MKKGDRYLVYADRDDSEIKIHGPLSVEQAEGFYAGAEWVNDSALEFLGIYRGISAARSAAAEQARGEEFADYEVEETSFEVPQLTVSQGELYLLYLDNDYDTLKLHGPLSLGRAEGFYAGAEWVNAHRSNIRAFTPASRWRERRPQVMVVGAMRSKS